MLTKGRCYVAGPMRSIEAFNFPAFDKARDLGISLGWQVISPADLDRQDGVDGSEPTPQQKMRMIDRDITSLYTCDAIALLPGWENSSGVAVELSLALFLGKTILDATTFEPVAYKPSVRWERV